MKKRAILHFALSPITILLFALYIWPDWYGVYHLDMTTRPVIYRVLIRAVVTALESISINHVQALQIAVFVSLVGFVVSMQYLHGSFRYNSLQAVFVAHASAWLIVVLMFGERKPYDFMTACLMTLSFSLLAREKGWQYIALFPFVCLNRETAFLLPIFCIVWFWRKLQTKKYILLITYQVIVFVAIQYGLHWYYADYPGLDAWVRPVENIRFALQFPYYTVAMLLMMVAFGLLIADHWRSKPLFLRVAFLTAFPVLFVLYIIFGYMFEVRVFIEIAPVAFLLCIKT